MGKEEEDRQRINTSEEANKPWHDVIVANIANLVVSLVGIAEVWSPVGKQKLRKTVEFLDRTLPR